MNRLEAAAGLCLVTLTGAGLYEAHRRLQALADTPAPPKSFAVLPQVETRPALTIEGVIDGYLAAETGLGAEGRRERLADLLTALESPELGGEPFERGAAEALASAAGTLEDSEVRRRAALLLARRSNAAAARDFVLKALDEGDPRTREDLLKAVGFASGVRGPSVHAKVVELADKGLIKDELLPSVLRRTGGIKAKDRLLGLMNGSDSTRLISACAVSLQDYRDPELLGPVLERLEAVGMLEGNSRLPWISPALLAAHLQNAEPTPLKRGLLVLAARPALVADVPGAVEKGLQAQDPETRRIAAVAVKKAVVGGTLAPERGEALLAGRLSVETEPVLKAELTGGLERVRGVSAQKTTGVQ
jgi:hypothetical protein